MGNAHGFDSERRFVYLLHWAFLEHWSGTCSPPRQLLALRIGFLRHCYISDDPVSQQKSWWMDVTYSHVALADINHERQGSCWITTTGIRCCPGWGFLHGHDWLSNSVLPCKRMEIMIRSSATLVQTWTPHTSLCHRLHSDNTRHHYMRSSENYTISTNL